MKKKIFSKRKILAAIVFLFGLGLCSYTLVSGIIVRQSQKGTVATYEEYVKQTDDDSLEKILEKAKEYNEVLYETEGFTVGNIDPDILSEKHYKSLLNVSGNGIMGSIEIPVIDVNLPIYHSTSEEVLSSAVGHVLNSSLPVGGESTRAILTGHRGLPSSQLFTRLDELKKGDLFFINVLNDTLAYKIYDIEIIEPDEVEKLEIVPGKDLVTLLTCTPYGINSHRLIVTGERIEYEEDVHASIEGKLPSLRELFFIAIPFIAISIVVIKVVADKKRKGGTTKDVEKN